MSSSYTRLAKQEAGEAGRAKKKSQPLFAPLFRVSTRLLNFSVTRNKHARGVENLEIFRKKKLKIFQN